MNVVAEITLKALEQHRLGPLERYAQCLRSAFEAHPPPFSAAWYGERFRDMARDPEWFANILVGNASTEGWGSSKLWLLAGKTHEEPIAELIRQHARDEARHSRMYSRMLDVVFPGLVTESLRREFQTFAPAYRSDDRPEPLPPYSHQQVLDNLLQMNVAEMRTMVNQMLVRPVVMTYCPPESRDHLTRMLDRLMWDETRHVGYTAQLMEQALAGGEDAEFVRDTVPLRFSEFNSMTLGEVGRPPPDVDPAYTA